MARPIDTLLLAAWPRLMGYALRLTREPETARDLMQQSALQALSSPAPPREQAASLAWLFTVVRNTWTDQVRRRSVRSRAAVAFEEADAWSFDDSLVTALAVRQALARLGPRERRVIELVDMQGLSYREAAEAIGVPIGTVMSRLSRARSHLLILIDADRRRPITGGHRR
jgi:RNA polymerase sigma-70 factor (ECF subfamily)